VTSSTREDVGEKVDGKTGIRCEQCKKDDADDGVEDDLAERDLAWLTLIRTGRRDWTASNDSPGGLHPCEDGAVGIAVANPRHDNVVDDAGGRGVGHHVFETVPDFKSEASIGRHDEKNEAVVDSLSADPPLFECPNGPVFDWSGAGGLADVNEKLMVRCSLVAFKLRIQRLGRSRRHEVRRIRDPLCWSGRYRGLLRIEAQYNAEKEKPRPGEFSPQNFTSGARSAPA
jgi:hypothetical protein